MIGSANLISKVYFPRLIVPLSTVVVALIDFLVSLVDPGRPHAVVRRGARLADPAAAGLRGLLALLAAIGPAIWAASLIVKYRDFRFIIPFVTQIGLYVSPVGFSSKVVPEHWQMLYSINPMVGVIDGFRWCILGGDSPIYWPGFLISLVVIAVMLVWGAHAFRRSERAFADMI